MSKPKEEEIFELIVMEYSSYFVGYYANLTIDVDEYIDPCYHDAPSEITIGMKIKDMIELRDKLNKGIEEALAIYEKYKNRTELK